MIYYFYFRCFVCNSYIVGLLNLVVTNFLTLTDVLISYNTRCWHLQTKDTQLYTPSVKCSANDGC